MVREQPAPLGNKSYFTGINVRAVADSEFDKVYSLFLTGLDKDPNVPSAYRLTATSVSGKILDLYFFDYGDHAWGMWCNKGCDPQSRFMLLDMTKKPNKALERTR